jgi:hypothetical protein
VWVHQEIGYAIANNIPILPLAIYKSEDDILPEAMLRELHAIIVPDDLEIIEERLTYQNFTNLVQRYEDPTYAIYQCSELTEDRTQLMIEYANEVLLMNYSGLVRQKGGLSSFHIPSEVITNQVWKDRYGDSSQSPIHCRLLRDERIVLEKHAKMKGCKIIINPDNTYETYGGNAWKTRLTSLLQFLESETGKKALVAIPDNLSVERNITMVGDWFYAESVSAPHIWQTIYTRHAPSIQEKIDLFDAEFKEILDTRGWIEENCREMAIQYIKRKIVEI